MPDAFRRATIRQAVTLPPAFGALSRRAVTVALQPAEIGSGLRVRRTDVGREWPVDLAHVVPMPNCTAIGDANGHVAFVEHLLAALRAALVSDVLILTDGPEIPLYDGSARALWEALGQAGRDASRARWEPLRLERPLAYQEGDAIIRSDSRPVALFSYELVHRHPLIGRQTACFSVSEDFGRELASARTFATAEELRALYGVDPTPEMEQLCVVVYPDHISDETLAPAALARHKLVDLLGDLFLCGRLIVGEVRASRTGHAHNRAFLRALLEQEAVAEA